MKWNNCRTTRREIDEAEFGEQPGEHAVAHIADCAACREFSDQRVLLRGLTSSLPMVAAPPDFDMRLRARLASPAATSPSGFWIWNLGFGTPVVAFAATIVVIMGALALLNQLGVIGSRSTPPPRLAQGPHETSSPITSPSVEPPREYGRGEKNVADERPSKPSPTKMGASPSPMIARFPDVKPGSSPPNKTVAPHPVDYSVRGAEVIKQQGDISTSTTPLSVSLRDSNGVTHNITLPPVSFGAQLGQHKPDAKTPVASNRVW